MSADNGIYILKSLDGYRVIHAQCIDNIYWHYTCCKNPDVKYDDEYSNFVCQNCNTINPPEETNCNINPIILKEYFENSEVFKTQDEALNRAIEIYREVEYCEYGIQIILGWEDKPFPK